VVGQKNCISPGSARDRELEYIYNFKKFSTAQLFSSFISLYLSSPYSRERLFILQFLHCPSSSHEVCCGGRWSPLLAGSRAWKFSAPNAKANILPIWQNFYRNQAPSETLAYGAESRHGMSLVNKDVQVAVLPARLHTA
jgi:hypothetical protein